MKTRFARRPGDEMTAQSRTAVSMVSAEVVRAALTFVERSETQNIQVEDLTSAAQVEYRTLLRAFKRYLQVKRYLKMRQLNLVRCALRTPEASSAMEVMADFGVTEFGRFATEYKRHFNELPSETLRGGLQETS
jgi:transcriptional regulator GlxA family with amidase domain